MAVNEDRPVDPQCPRCKANEWQDRGTAVYPVYKSDTTTEMRVRVLVCSNCGFVAQHNEEWEAMP